VLTHATTLAATLALLIFAGEVIRPFAWVMAFGVFVATFSLDLRRRPLLLWIERTWPRTRRRRARARTARGSASRSSPSAAR
jgi:preprotein translocase subunit SecF